jgi:hypothetical protein
MRLISAMVHQEAALGHLRVGHGFGHAAVAGARHTGGHQRGFAFSAAALLGPAFDQRQ